jgi:hypothetical protein
MSIDISGCFFFSVGGLRCATQISYYSFPYFLISFPHLLTSLNTVIHIHLKPQKQILLRSVFSIVAVH